MATITTSDGDCSAHRGDRCRNARTTRCTCACGGANHGARMRDHEHAEAMPLTDLRVFNGPAEQRFRALAPGADADIRLWRDATGNALANIPQSLCLHSPTGFEWGYHGSGPAELALNILNLFVTPAMAHQLHQQFKDKYIATMARDGGTIHAADVKKWIADVWERLNLQRQLSL